MIIISVGLAFVGCILLSVSLKRHYRQVWPQSQSFERWRLPNRVIGFGAVFLSLAPCVFFRGLWIGLVLWLSVLALVAFMQAMLLAWRPQYSVVYVSAGMLMILGGMLT
jgi:hypothetical protein